MNLKHLPDLSLFLSTTIFDADPDAERAVVEGFVNSASPYLQRRLIAQLKDAISQADLGVEELGTISNRWFAEEDEARQWLGELLESFQAGDSDEGAAAARVLDVNGAELLEGDSVLTIKDLKVKGGSSDLKRGTLIKKIHLVGDPDVIECRVDVSTLVLKTCFLKKA